jgi:hypothetical protein
MKIDIGSSVNVKGTRIQGRTTNSGNEQYIKNYYVEYSIDDVNYLYANGGVLLNGLTSLTKDDTIDAYFSTTVIARYIKITPNDYTGYISMRAGLIIEAVEAPSTYTVTVSGDPDVFYIDETPQPNFTFTAGETYVFDQSDPSNTGNQLVLGTTSDLSSSLISYQTVVGTPGQPGAYTSFTASGETVFYFSYETPEMGYYVEDTEYNPDASFRNVSSYTTGSSIGVSFNEAYSLLDGYLQWRPSSNTSQFIVIKLNSDFSESLVTGVVTQGRGIQPPPGNSTWQVYTTKYKVFYSTSTSNSDFTSTNFNNSNFLPVDSGYEFTGNDTNDFNDSGNESTSSRNVRKISLFSTPVNATMIRINPTDGLHNGNSFDLGFRVGLMVRD